MDAKEKLFRVWEFFAWMDNARQGLEENDRWIEERHYHVINKAWNLCSLNYNANDLCQRILFLPIG